MTVSGQMAFQSHSTGKEPAPTTPTVTLSFFLMSLPKAIANPSTAASKIARHRRNFTTAKDYSVLISKKSSRGFLERVQEMLGYVLKPSN